MKHRRKMDRRSLSVESLEERRVLAASAGWDGPGQGSAQLSYYIGQTPSGLSQSTFQSAIQSALKAWSDVANLSFVQTSQPGLNNSLDFTFQSLDGGGGTLAQAYFPADVNRGRLAGDIQFDSAERWEIGNTSGNAAFDLVLVAAHEIGHALGLEHSSDTSAVLSPSVSPAQSFTALDSADISAIRALYAAAPSGSSSQGNPSGTATEITPTGTANPTGTTRTTHRSGIPRNPSFTAHTWLANWYSRFGRISSDAGTLAPGTQGAVTQGAGLPTDQILFPSLDVNLDNSVSAVDALLVINVLNHNGQLTIQSSFQTDTSGDGQVTPIDALLVINGIGKQPSTTVITIDMSGEGPLITLKTEPVDDSNSTDTDDSPSTGTGVDDGVVDPGEDGSLGDDTPVDTSDDDTVPEEDPEDDSDTAGDTDDDADDEVHHPGHGRGWSRLGFPVGLGRGGLLSPERVDNLFDRFDNNADDLLTEDEVPGRLWTRWIEDGVDADSDAAISLVEMQTAVRAAEQKNFDALDKDGNGLLTETEVSTRWWTKWSEAEADTDADGGISLDELLAFGATAANRLGLDCNPSGSDDAPPATSSSTHSVGSHSVVQFASASRKGTPRFRS